MKCGVIYIAFGKRYADEAISSAASLKAVSKLDVTLFTDQPVSSPHVDTVVPITPTHKRAKIDFISQSPYDRTLYLDSDTKIVRDISDVFAILDRFNIAAVHDHSRKSSRWSKVFPEYSQIPYAFPEFNGGVILFDRSPETARFFDLWRKFFNQYSDVTHGQDQASFRTALWHSDLKIHSLPFEYNVRNHKIRQKMHKRASKPADESLLKPRILHWHGVEKSPLFAWLRAAYRPMRY